MSQLLFDQQGTPTTPASGTSVAYPKSDGKWYSVGPDGIEVQMYTSGSTTPTASTVSEWDANKNMSAEGFIPAFQSIATAAGSTTLAVGSPQSNLFTGSTTQTVVLPVATTLVAGQYFLIANTSSGNVTVNTSGANLIATLTQNKSVTVTCINTAGGTGTASWNWEVGMVKEQALPIADGGTGQTTQAAAFDALQPMTTGGDLIYGGTSGTGTRLANGSANQVLQSNGTTTAPTWTTNISGSAANVTGTVAVNHGGTGQTTANAGFNALSPMTTGGDVIYGGASGAGTRLANGTAGQVLTSAGTTLAPTWSTPGSAATYPTHCTIWPGNEWTINSGVSGGWSTNVPNNDGQYCRFYQSSPANGDSVQQTFFLAAGTYTFNVLGTSGAGNGKLDWYIDNVTFLTGDDWYAASGTVNRIVSTASVVVTGSGVHTLKVIVNGKNASATNYYMNFQKMWFQ